MLWLSMPLKCANKKNLTDVLLIQLFVLYLQMSHAAATALCRCVKLQCEFYPSREATLCLDPYSGIGFALWCLCR